MLSAVSSLRNGATETTFIPAGLACMFELDIFVCHPYMAMNVRFALSVCKVSRYFPITVSQAFVDL
jgi:hypothetical protein